MFNALEVKECLLWCTGLGVSTAHEKDSGSLSPGLLFLDETYCVCRCHLTLFVSSSGNWSVGSGHKNDDTLAALIAMSNKLSFIFDPGEFCLLPAFIKQYQDNYLAYRQGAISDPLQFLTVLTVRMRCGEVMAF